MLTDFFRSGMWKEDINEGNPLGYGGAIANVFANLLENLWDPAARVFDPYELREKVRAGSLV